MNDTATTVMPAISKESDADQALVRRYLSGDVLAFDDLMARHERPVYLLCFRFVRNREDALDLTQEVFIKAFENLASFRGDSKFKTWIYRVAVNHCLNHVKKNSREFVEVTDAIGSIKPTVHRTLLENERRAIVRDMMECLPPKQKAILQLRMNDNLSYDEIATILNRSVSTVKSSVFFALTKLKKLVKQSALAGRPF
jgi:RNA polymerase sigma-70 factor (ECF subfamily)